MPANARAAASASSSIRRKYCRQPAEQQVRVGDGRPRPALAVAGRTRIGAGALGADAIASPLSSQTIEPPPAPTVCRSTAGSLSGKPPISRSAARLAGRRRSARRRSRSRHVERDRVLEPGPAGKQRRAARSRSRPDRSATAGCAAASSSDATPPDDRITSGSGKPAPAAPSPSARDTQRRRARGTRQRRSSTPARTRETRARPRATQPPAHRAAGGAAQSLPHARDLDHETRTAGRPRPPRRRIGQRVELKRREHPVRPVRSRTPKQRSIGTSGRDGPRRAGRARPGSAVAGGAVLEALGPDERRARALALEERVRGDGRPWANRST